METLIEKEQELKETAEQKSLVLMKSKSGYMLVDYYTSRIIAGRDYSFSIEDAERFLASY